MSATKKKSAGKKRTTSAATKKYLCPYCLKEKSKSNFYKSTDPELLTGITVMCKQCAYDRAVRKDEDGNEIVTKEFIMSALERLDKPFLEKIWDSSYMEVHNQENRQTKSNYWAAYIKNISMVNYETMRWKDSDIFKGVGQALINNDSSPKELTPEEKNKQDEILELYQQNKKDVVRLLGYDPFEKESEGDKPYLYAQLVKFIDASEDSNDDAMLLSSTIEIIKSFYQAEKLNEVIAGLMFDSENIKRNISTIKALEETKNKIMSSALNLAKDSCISIKHSANSSKGANTWTGKVKELRERKLREAEVNVFDIGTCEGMRQVAEISMAAILKQIVLDENDYTEMIKDQVKLINYHEKRANEFEEQARLLLRENIDLKNFLAEKELLHEAESLQVIDVDYVEARSEVPENAN